MTSPTNGSERHVTVTIPDELYRQIESVAEATQRPVQEVVLDAVMERFARFSVHPGRSAMLQEIAAFEKMHEKLRHHYLGQYVAVYEGNIIDQGTEEEGLVDRIERDYPDQIVLIRRVEEQPQGDLRVRSPRFASNER